MNEIQVSIETVVNPTEDFEKIKLALENLFIFSSIELVKKNKISVIARVDGIEGLTVFKNLLKQDRILNAARKVLIKGSSDKSTVFYVNKQAAYMKRISFCEPTSESVLGSIKVQIESDDIRTLIDWLTSLVS